MRRLAGSDDVQGAGGVSERGTMRGARAPRARGAGPTGRCSRTSAWPMPRAAGPDARPAGPRRLARAWAARRPPPRGPPDAVRGPARARGPACCGCATGDSRHGHPIAPNRLGRRFEAARPNQVWLGDLTYVRTGEGWLYLAAVLDLHTRKIVGWSMRETLHGPGSRSRRSTWRSGASAPRRG